MAALPRPSRETRATVVGHAPLVPVALVVLAADGVVPGTRRNDPARGEWFVPGGRVHEGGSGGVDGVGGVVGGMGSVSFRLGWVGSVSFPLEVDGEYLVSVGYAVGSVLANAAAIGRDTTDAIGPAVIPPTRCHKD